MLKRSFDDDQSVERKRLKAIPADAFNKAVVPESIKGASIGDILRESGRLSDADMQRVVALQGKENILFGAAAIALGILTEEDVKWALAAQYSHPCVQTDETSLSRDLFVVHEPFSPQVEAFRSIRSGLTLAGVGKSIKAVGILSPNDREGKTLIAANLAMVFAQFGTKTLLLDLNFRRPRVHEIFNLRNNTGASSLIIRRALFEEAVHRTSINTLDILPSGPRPPNPLELLGWRETRNLVASFKELYDVVIIDTPAFLKTADAMGIATLCDGTLLVALKGKTKLDSFGLLKKQLETAGVQIMGAVVNEIRDIKKR